MESYIGASSWCFSVGIIQQKIAVSKSTQTAPGKRKASCYTLELVKGRPVLQKEAEWFCVSENSLKLTPGNILELKFEILVSAS